MLLSEQELIQRQQRLDVLRKMVSETFDLYHAVGTLKTACAQLEGMPGVDDWRVDSAKSNLHEAFSDLLDHCIYLGDLVKAETAALKPAQPEPAS